MKFTTLILCVVIVFTFRAADTAAQELRTTVTAHETSSDETAALPEYVVEVRRPDGCLVSPVSTKHNSGFVMYTLPRPDKIPPDSAGQPLTSKVFVAAIQRGDKWEVKISIGRGEFYDAGDTMVGNFKLNLNERASVTEMSRFGLSPIGVGVLKIIRQEAESPTFINLTQSISVESIEANNLPDPYKVHLRNNSRNDLIAFQYNTFRREEFLALEWVGRGLVSPLVKAGQTYKLEVKSEDKSCGDGEGYRPNQSHRVDLVSAVFADGTYEGEPGLAGLIKGTALGNRRNLEQVVEVLRATADDPDEVASQLNYLKDRLNEDTDPSMAGLLHVMLPAMPANSTDALNGFVRAGMHEVKVSVTGDVQHFELIKQRDNPQLTKQWLERTRAKYERWLAAAERMTAH